MLLSTWSKQVPLQLSQCPKASRLGQHQQNNLTMRYPRKNSGVSLKAKNSSLQEGNWLFLQYLPNFSITELTAHWHRMQKLVFNSATSDHRRSRMEVSRATTKNLLSFSSWFISQEIESSSSPPPTALSKHRQRGRSEQHWILASFQGWKSSFSLFTSHYAAVKTWGQRVFCHGSWGPGGLLFNSTGSAAQDQNETSG